MERQTIENHTPSMLVLEPGRDIGMGEWRVGSDVLFTSGASTCVVLAAHNKTTGRGLLGHFSTLAKTDRDYNDTHAFEEAVAELSTLGDPIETEISLLGAGPYFEDGVDTVAEDREYAVQTLLSYAKKHDLPNDSVALDWSPTQHTSIDVKLDCRLGILEVQPVSYS